MFFLYSVLSDGAPLYPDPFCINGSWLQIVGCFNPSVYWYNIVHLFFWFTWDGATRPASHPFVHWQESVGLCFEVYTGAGYCVLFWDQRCGDFVLQLRSKGGKKSVRAPVLANSLFFECDGLLPRCSLLYVLRWFTTVENFRERNITVSELYAISSAFGVSTWWLTDEYVAITWAEFIFAIY